MKRMAEKAVMLGHDLVDAPPADLISIDTTRNSILHRLMRRRGGELRAPSVAYLGAAAATYGLLIVIAAATYLLANGDMPSHRLPLHRDWNIMFMFLVSFPTLVTLTITDDAVLRSALQRIQRDGILMLPNTGAARQVTAAWEQRFARINVLALVAGIAMGLSVVRINYVAYTPPSLGFWIADRGRLLPVGYVFFFCIFLFYVVVPIILARSAAISLLLRDIVSQARLSLLPAHPDRCGGLRPIGRVGLRNQYALSVCGINVVLLYAVSYAYLDMGSNLRSLVVAAIVAYVAMGPLVFLGPLLSFRQGMLATKIELLSEVAQRLRIELRRLRQQLPEGQITKADEELVERLRKIGAVIEELPVWPFDASTLKKFVSAYVIPLVGAVGYVIFDKVVGVLIGN
jgi:hypothetical protein